MVLPHSPDFAVVFDFDGVIIDSESAEYECHREICRAHGVTLSHERWTQEIGTWTEPSIWLEWLCRESGQQIELQAFLDEKKRLFAELIVWEPMRGIAGLIDELVEARVPIGIASAASANWINRATERLGIRHHFSAIVTRNDVSRFKPAPDVYVEAARRLNVSPAQAVALEDSRNGVTAARAAGLSVVAIPHPLTDGHDLSDADLRVNHAGDLTVSILRSLVERRAAIGHGAAVP